MIQLTFRALDRKRAGEEEEEFRLVVEVLEARRCLGDEIKRVMPESGIGRASIRVRTGGVERISRGVFRASSRPFA
jgi:hypothetical protein